MRSPAWVLAGVISVFVARKCATFCLGALYMWPTKRTVCALGWNQRTRLAVIRCRSSLHRQPKSGKNACS